MKKHQLRIVVTAVGGDLGQAIVKALHLIKSFDIHVIGCDASEGLGAAFVDKYYSLPYAESENYISELRRISVSEDVDLIIPASEIEIALLGKIENYPVLTDTTKLLCQHRDWYGIYADKLSCYRQLEGSIDLALFADGSNKEDVERLLDSTDFPLVVKPRCSNGSKSIVVAQNEPALELALKEIDSPVVQEYISNDGGEFSVGAFVGNGIKEVVAFVRELGPFGGASYIADSIVQDEAVLEYAMSVANLTKVQGSCNIQVRKSAKGVRLLEINPRFSSLVAARAACGFVDLEWSVCMALDLEMRIPPSQYKGIKFRRYLHEMLDLGDGFCCVDEWMPRRTSIL